MPTADGKQSGHHRSRSTSFAREREKFFVFKVSFADLEKTTSEVYIDSIMINIGNANIIYMHRILSFWYESVGLNMKLGVPQWSI